MMPRSPPIPRLLPPQMSQELMSSSSVRALFQSASHLLTPLLTPSWQAEDELCPQKRRGGVATPRTSEQTLFRDRLYRGGQFKMRSLEWTVMQLSGEGNDHPLQYSCLENPMDIGAWLATVHGVTKSWTRPQQHSRHNPI